ncbi:GrpB family protein [Kribbella sp. NPDC051620]|uniref:GrpB family protein n=1 Tax=Kribbella sp. NPDC051620 TaxID=3364120 RepID=UPI00379FA732
MTILAEYDEAWAARYEALAAKLREAFGDTVTELEHIGSTAVPGLVAKPVIDIAARAVSLEVASGKDLELADLGFQHEPAGPPGRRTYTRVVDGILTSNLHVFPADAWDTLNQRILRDHLRATPEAVRRYSELKRRLATEGLSGFDYTTAKTTLIQELTDDARRLRGLPSVPVWET